MDDDLEISKLSLKELQSEISRCAWGAENGGTSQGRKSYFKRLVWLEKKREEIFEVEAPRRAFRER